VTTERATESDVSKTFVGHQSRVMWSRQRLF